MTTEKINQAIPEEQVDAKTENTTVQTPEIEVESDKTPITEPVEIVDLVEAVAEAAAKPKSKAKPKAAVKPKVEVKAKTVAKKEPSEEEEDKEERLDFSDEEAELAELAGDAAEFDLGDESDEEQEELEQQKEERKTDESDVLDLASKNRTELLDIFAELLEKKQVQKIRRDVEAIKVAFYKLHRGEVERLHKAFVEGGGVSEEFVAPIDEQEQRLKDLFGEYRGRRDEYIAKLEGNKEDNLAVKLKVIEDLKELVGSNETMNVTFNAFRELQQKWREAGAVPQASLKGLWETYNHHVENFYSFIKINKELRDLDLKRNYEAKIALCEEVEALLMEPSIVVAFRKLQKLHDQWRETGPVANEYKEVLWERFKEVSAKINKEHQDYFEGIKEEQKGNLALKAELCVNVENLAEREWTTRKEWNKASDKLIEIQKVWKTIGFAPKRDNAKIYERFRKACDKFFDQKRKFYGQMKIEMEHNLAMKTEICEAAEALAESEDWKKTTDELIALQKRWKETGVVARRHSDAIWKRFRTACDKFFTNKSKHFASKESKYDDNLAAKRALLNEIETTDFVAGGFDMVKEFQRRWSEIGFVPIKLKDAIQKEYKEAMDVAFNTLRGSTQDRRMERFKGKVQSMKGSGGDRKLGFERDRIYARVKQLEADIALLENNIGFFSKSKNAEAMIKDVKAKIERGKEEMAAAIEQIKLIDNQE